MFYPSAVNGAVADRCECYLISGRLIVQYQIIGNSEKNTWTGLGHWKFAISNSTYGTYWEFLQYLLLEGFKSSCLKMKLGGLQFNLARTSKEIQKRKKGKK